jgi:hypothetical protein
MPGIEERITEPGIRVVRLHYTANPAKRSQEWQREARTAYVNDRDWEREMEINWAIASGLPVYADMFVRDWHVAKEPLRALERIPIRRGWDFGLTPACVFYQMDTMTRFNVLCVHVTWDGRGAMKQLGVDGFADEIVILSNDWFPGFEFVDYGDPAAWQKAQTDERTCAEILKSKKIYLKPGPVTWTARKTAIERVLSTAIGGRPQLCISPDCMMILEGFEGAYRYEQIGDTGKFKDHVEKNAWSHPMNGLEYGIGAMLSMARKRDEDNDERRRPAKRKQPRDRFTGY